MTDFRTLAFSLLMASAKFTATGACIMLTTSHKFRYPLPQWEQIFRTKGVNASISRFKDETIFHSRKEEIINWYNTCTGNTNFVIIDDDKSLNGLASALKIRLVATSALIGLTDELANKAIEILEYSAI